MRKILFYSIVLNVALGLFSCSQNSTSKVSVGYHNTTARFNAYFLAKEKMKEIETVLIKKTNTDYNKILDLYPVYDTNFAKTLRPQFDECIKKASLPIQWHKNSKWVDNSYILIGKCRLYGLDLSNAETTFKFVNAKGKDEQDKLEALCLLMRTYIESHQYDFADQVYKHVSAQDLNKKNTRDIALNRAFYHQLHFDYVSEAAELEKAYKLIRDKDFRSRIMFILAQIYQMQGEDKKSYAFYRKVLKNSPPYELSFFTKLYMAQVSTLEGATVKKLNKYFFKLLKDPKNKEYKDKIYYELAKFELKQSNVPKSIEYLKLSLKEGNNPTQKAYTFLKLGEIHYDKLKKYVVAHQYYDSCIAFMPQTNPDYLAIKQRAMVLDEFVKHYTTMTAQDSLLALTEKSPAELEKLISQYIEEDIARQKEAYVAVEKAKKDAKNKAAESQTNNTALANNGFGDPNVKWYFYNPTLLATGKSEFVKNWGNRPNEDNWRRSQKETNFNEGDKTVSAENQVVEEVKEKGFVPVMPDKAKLLANIPSSDAAKDSANAKIANAYFNLGRIYYAKLKETPNAIYVYEKHLSRYPNHAKDPEVMYALYIIYNQENNESEKNKVKAELIQKHPHSIYAKLIQNPNYLTENKAVSEKVNKSYREIYLTYESGAYSQADTMIYLLQNQYPDNDIMDKLDMLQALIKGKEQNWTAYTASLEGIKEKYTGTDYAKKADNLLLAYNTKSAQFNTAPKSDSTNRLQQVDSTNQKPATQSPVETPVNPNPPIENQSVETVPAIENKEVLIPENKK